MTHILRLLSIVAAALAMAGSAAAQGEVQLKLVADVDGAVPGETFHAAVHATILEGWHIYWTNPGDAGIATVVNWEPPAGYEVGPTLYPVPHRYVQEVTADFKLVTHTFEGEVLLVAEVTVPADAAPGTELSLNASVNWQACKEVCTPEMTTPVSLKIPVLAAAKASPQAPAISAALENSQQGVTQVQGVFKKEDTQLYLVGGVPGELTEKLQGQLFFLPSSAGLIPATAEPIVAVEDTQLSLWAGLEDAGAELPEGLSGFIVGEGAPPLWVTSADLPDPAAAAGAIETGALSVYPAPDSPQGKEIRAAIAEIAGGAEKKAQPLGLMLFFAFIGGIILNLMPCVFPVLGIKILGFVQQAGSDRAKIRRHGWVFAAGVLISLWVLVGALLAIRAAGESAGWGFQLQQPWFLVSMIAVMFIFALNLSGVFELGTSLIGAGNKLQSQHGYGGSFFSGVLAVMVATPCTGPFMAPALGFALTGPAYVGFLIFTALALGLALPYVLLSHFPALIEKLPRPGPWMETFKQLMAFPLYATVVWLLWNLGKSNGYNAVTWTLLGLVVVSMGFWLYGKYAVPVKRATTRWLARGATAAALACFVMVGIRASKAEAPGGTRISGKTVHGLAYEPFDPRKVVEHQRAGRAVFIDFTANW